MNKYDFLLPFHESEMESEDAFPGFGPGTPDTPVFKTPIKYYENLMLFLSGEKPAWMPSYLEFKMFNPSLLADNKAKTMVLEGLRWEPKGLFHKDYFGIEWELVPKAMGAIVRPGNPKVPDITEWEKYIEFPDLTHLDWSRCRAENMDYLNDSRAIQMTVFTGLFERLVSFTDMEPALVALIDEDQKPAVHRLFDRLCVFYDEMFCQISKWFDPDLLWFHDDWGSQRAPLFSLETCREMIVPYLKRIVASAHDYGIGFELHSCGKNEMLVPAMIEAGVDMWAGQDMNDKEFLYKEYGREIKLGVNPPPLPAEASESELEDIVGRFLDTYPANVYVGQQFAMDGRYYPMIYRESRKRYNRIGTG